MKRVIRVIMLCVCALMLSAAPLVNAGAASNIPGNVGTLKATAQETSVNLKWPRVKGAKGYYVYRVNGTAYTRIRTTSGTSCTISRLTAGNTYRYAVKAYKKVKGKIYLSPNYSRVVSASTKLRTPGTPSDVQMSATGSNQLYIKWKSAKYASGYEICQYDAKTKKYKVFTRVARTTKGCYLRNLKFGQTYQFAVRAYRQSGKAVSYGKYSRIVSGKPVEMSSAAKKIHGIRFNAKTRRAVVIYNYTKKKEQRLAKGAKVVTTSKNPSGYITAYLTNGDQIKIKGTDVRTYALNYNSNKDYSKAVKEEYINKKNLDSPSRYLVWIDQYKCRTNWFKGSKGNWKLVRTAKVGIGWFHNMSPRGITSIKKKNRWGVITGNGPELYYTYNSRTGQGNAFHSDCGGPVGKPISHGCIRLRWNDLNWMYNTIPVGTTVYSA